MFTLLKNLSLLLIFGYVAQLEKIDTWIDPMMSSPVRVTSDGILRLLCLNDRRLLYRLRRVPEYILDVLEICLAFAFPRSCRMLRAFLLALI